jgi:hypothetical protein
MMVPISALATVKPRPALLRWKTASSAPVVPEITAVSKPKRSPPREATTALWSRTLEIFIGQSRLGAGRSRSGHTHAREGDACHAAHGFSRFNLRTYRAL